MSCQDCLRTIKEAGWLWTAPGGDKVCADCFENRTGRRPASLTSLNKERALKISKGLNTQARKGKE